jgi:hypothetical protein
MNKDNNNEKRSWKFWFIALLAVGLPLTAFVVFSLPAIMPLEVDSYFTGMALGFTLGATFVLVLLLAIFRRK